MPFAVQHSKVLFRILSIVRQ